MPDLFTWTGLAVWAGVYTVAVLAAFSWVAVRIGRKAGKVYLTRALTGINNWSSDEDPNDEREAVKRLLEMRRRSIAERFYRDDYEDLDEFMDEHEATFCPCCRKGGEITQDRLDRRAQAAARGMMEER